MTKTIEIEFEKGGRFTATLLDDKAPQTCKMLWENLPTKGIATQARFNGEELFFKTDWNMRQENQKTDFSAGDIAFNPDPKWKAMILYYGNNLRVSTPFNHIARIIEKLNELKLIGERIWLKGTENVYVSKKSEGRSAFPDKRVFEES